MPMAHGFFRKLIIAYRNKVRTSLCDFQRINNKSQTKGARTVSANIATVDGVSVHELK